MPRENERSPALLPHDRLGIGQELDHSKREHRGEPFHAVGCDRPKRQPVAAAREIGAEFPGPFRRCIRGDHVRALGIGRQGDHGPESLRKRRPADSDLARRDACGQRDRAGMGCCCLACVRGKDGGCEKRTKPRRFPTHSQVVTGRHGRPPARRREQSGPLIHDHGQAVAAEPDSPFSTAEHGVFVAPGEHQNRPGPASDAHANRSGAMIQSSDLGRAARREDRIARGLNLDSGVGAEPNDAAIGVEQFRRLGSSRYDHAEAHSHIRGSGQRRPAGEAADRHTRSW